MIIIAQFFQISKNDYWYWNRPTTLWATTIRIWQFCLEISTKPLKQPGKKGNQANDEHPNVLARHVVHHCSSRRHISALPVERAPPTPSRHCHRGGRLALLLKESVRKTPKRTPAKTPAKTPDLPQSTQSKKKKKNMTVYGILSIREWCLMWSSYVSYKIALQTTWEALVIGKVRAYNVISGSCPTTDSTSSRSWLCQCSSGS